MKRRKKAHKKLIVDGKTLKCFRWDRVPEWVTRLTNLKEIKLVTIGCKQRKRIEKNTPRPAGLRDTPLKRGLKKEVK